MIDAIVRKRLIRNLRYRVTYLQIFETYLDSDLDPDLVRLLTSLQRDQQLAITRLSDYLCQLDVDVQELEPDRTLLMHAVKRHNVLSRLRFIHHGLETALSWYKMQLTDRQMTADHELESLLLELGEVEAAALWRVSAVAHILRIPLDTDQRSGRKQQGPDPQPMYGRGSRLAEDWNSK